MTRRHFMQMLGAVACAITYPLRAARGAKPPATYAGIDYGSGDSTVITITNISPYRITHITCNGEALVVDGNVKMRTGDVLTVRHNSGLTAEPWTLTKAGDEYISKLTKTRM